MTRQQEGVDIIGELEARLDEPTTRRFTTESIEWCVYLVDRIYKGDVPVSETRYRVHKNGVTRFVPVEIDGQEPKLLGKIPIDKFQQAEQRWKNASVPGGLEPRTYVLITHGCIEGGIPLEVRSYRTDQTATELRVTDERGYWVVGVVTQAGETIQTRKEDLTIMECKFPEAYQLKKDIDGLIAKKPYPGSL